MRSLLPGLLDEETEREKQDRERQLRAYNRNKLNMAEVRVAEVLAQLADMIANRDASQAEEAD